MAIYLISGKLGSGKTLSAVGRIRDKLLAGCRVATNLDLRLENLLPPYAGRRRRSDGASGWYQPVNCIRIPDKPTVEDLELIGCGNEEMDESKNGIIVLDELAVWLNSRTFNDKSRAPVIDWLLHSRKHGWDVYFICQHIEQIDKQVRQALVEYLVVCRRLDRIKIPLIGGLIKSLTAGYISGNLPKVHVATVRYGTQPDAIKSDTWVYQGKDLYNGYDTRQVFSDSYAHGPYTYLPPWHLGGYKHKTRLDLIKEWFDQKPYDIPLKPKHPLVEKLEKLSPDDRLKHWRRLEALGAFAQVSA